MIMSAEDDVNIKLTESARYRGAEVPARAACRTLVAIEEQLGRDMRQFL